MAIAEGPVTDRAGFRIGLAPDTNVLWLTGEHDVATCSGLRLVLVDLPGYGYARISKERHAEWRPLIEGFLRHSRELRGMAARMGMPH